MAAIIEEGRHLTPEGLKEIRIIKAGMNSQRNNNFKKKIVLPHLHPSAPRSPLGPLSFFFIFHEDNKMRGIPEY